MHPAAEDNYGMDACSLLCLHSNPPVLVVATSSSVLHHCVVLMSQDGADVDVSCSSQEQQSVVVLGGVVYVKPYPGITSMKLVANGVDHTVPADKYTLR